VDEGDEPEDVRVFGEVDGLERELSKTFASVDGGLGGAS
jgi:hypothetical protein